jgi:hypothetical protein
MVNKLLQFTYRFPLLITVIFLPSTILFCWVTFLKYKVTNIYYLDNVVYLLCAFLLLMNAHKYKNFKNRVVIFLFCASLLTVFSFVDFYLITFSYETSDLGGKMSSPIDTGTISLSPTISMGFGNEIWTNMKILLARTNRLSLQL